MTLVNSVQSERQIGNTIIIPNSQMNFARLFIHLILTTFLFPKKFTKKILLNHLRNVTVCQNVARVYEAVKQFGRLFDNDFEKKSSNDTIY